LQDWASAAGEKMTSAARNLDGKQARPAAADQQAAIDELDKIWDAVIPFHPLLARDLADQTKIAGSLAPSGSSADSSSANSEPADKNDPHRDETGSSQKNLPAGTGHASLGTESDDLAPLTEIQERTLRRTQLLKLKAEDELERMEKSPPPDAKQSGDDKSAGKDDTKDPALSQPKPVDPKLIKEGYQKAIDLAPQAVLQMERAVKSLKQKEPKAAYPPASLARQILDEIQKAQPRPEQPDQKQQDQNKKDEEKKKQEQKQKDQQKQEQQKKDEQKSEQQKKDESEKKDQEKKDQQQKNQEEPNKSDEQKPDQKQPQVSRDRIEEALRRVRERQQEKRERDRTMKARLFGRAPVEKDW
jgi:hypothetical protein